MIDCLPANIMLGGLLSCVAKILGLPFPTWSWIAARPKRGGIPAPIPFPGEGCNDGGAVSELLPGILRWSGGSPNLGDEPEAPPNGVLGVLGGVGGCWLIFPPDDVGGVEGNPLNIDPGCEFPNNAAESMPAWPNGESGGKPKLDFVALPTPGGVMFEDGGDAGAIDVGGFFAPSKLFRPSVGSLAVTNNEID